MELFLLIIGLVFYFGFQNSSKAAKKAKDAKAQFTQGIPPEKPTQAEAMERWRQERHTMPPQPAAVTPGKLSAIRPTKKPSPASETAPMEPIPEVVPAPVSIVPPAAPTDAYKVAPRAAGTVFSPTQLRTAIITREILDKPVALRQRRRI